MNDYTDPYRITDSAPATPTRVTSDSSPVVSGILWTLTAVLAGTNTALSIAGLELVGAFFGGAAIVCLVVLAVRFVRRRRS